jgi:hypothetical protein
MYLQAIIVRPVRSFEESIFRELMQAQHYLGALPKIGNTLLVCCNIPKRLASFADFFSCCTSRQ